MFWTSKLISHVTQFSPFVPESPRRLSNYMFSLSSCEAARQLISSSARPYEVKTWPAVIIPPTLPPRAQLSVSTTNSDALIPLHSSVSSFVLVHLHASGTGSLCITRHTHTHTHTHTYIYFYHRLALHVINFKGQRLWQGNLFTVAEGLRFKMRSRCSSQTDGRHGLFSEVQWPRCVNKRLWISSGGTKWPRKMSEVGLWWTESVLRLSKYPLPG